MEDLAPDIVRQRLLIEEYFTTDVDQDVIRQYLTQAPQALHLQAYGTPTIFAPGGLGQEQNEGYDAFMPLIDSGISLYVWSAPRFLSVVVFRVQALQHRRRARPDTHLLRHEEGRSPGVLKRGESSGLESLVRGPVPLPSPGREGRGSEY